ncbi:TldD/PmbA family protein [Candidatus Sumerlaeota bacterium]|nr:TldD/PmbA family protein [Candidatus Sumerlaeota bacterium]
MDEAQAVEILESLLKHVDADGAEASFHSGARFTARFADNRLTQNVQAENATVSLAVSYGQRHGGASTNDLSPESLKALAERAQAAARVSPPDPEHMPPVTPEEAGEYSQVEAWDEATAALPAGERIEAVCAAMKDVEAAGYRLSGAHTSSAGLHVLMNSAGVRCAHRSTESELHCTALGDHGSGWAQATSVRDADIDTAGVAREALEIARAAQHPTDIEPGRYTVILRPAAVWEMIPFYLVCDAKATDEGRTCLRGKLGTQIVDERVTLRSEPAFAACPGAPFQGDGMASSGLSWIGGGVLKHLCTSRYWARQSKRLATGWPSNLIFDGGEASLEELIASTERGILVTRFWYIRDVDPMESLLTGMTRDGLFLIEDGKISRPLIQLRFNDSVLGCLNRLEAIGQCERVENTYVPALKIRDFNFASKTKF